MLLLVLISGLCLALPSTPCLDDLTYTSSCPGWKKYCSGTKWTSWMEVFCPETCSVCMECSCEDNPAYRDRCKTWKRHCTSTNTATREFVIRRCPSTCNECSCCAERLDRNSHCDAWRKSGYCENGPYVAWMWNNCYKSCTCGE